MKPEMIKMGALSCQACVPSSWSDKQVIDFVEKEYPCGTENGWAIRKDKEDLAGDPERNPCDTRIGFVHITLDA